MNIFVAFQGLNHWMFLICSLGKVRGTCEKHKHFKVRIVQCRGLDGTGLSCGEVHNVVRICRMAFGFVEEYGSSWCRFNI